MKKFLLSMAALVFAGSAFAADVVLAETPTRADEGKEVYSIDYSTTDWNFYVMGYTPEVVDGVLTSIKPADEGWYQYFIGDLIPTEVGKSYTAVVKIKTSSPASMALNMGWGWGEGDIINSTINTTEEWAEISHTFENIGGTSSNLVLQPGGYDGTVEIAWVKVYEVEGGETPDEPVTPPAGEGEEVYSIDYSTTTWDFYVMGYTPQNENGVLVSNYPGEWYQYFIADRIVTEVGKSYTAVVKIKTSTAASLALNMGWGWGDGEQAQGTLKTTTEWTEVSYTFENVGGNSCNLVLQPGTYDGTVEIEWVKVYEVAGGETPDEPVTPPSEGKEVYSIDYSTTTWDFYVMGYTPQNENGVLVSNYPDGWYQYFIADRIATEAGKSYKAVVKIKTSTAASLALNMGWGWGDGEQAQGTLKTTTDWTEASYTFENVGGNSCNLVLQPGTYEGTVEIEWVKVYALESSAVEEIAPAVENGRIVVYNLLGVKVLDTDDASQLNTLRKGIYIVNGKKVAL